MALLVSPKNPNTQETNSWRLHAINRPNPNNQLTLQNWDYQATECYSRTNRIAALCLLGKTQKNGEELSEILGSVELVQDDPNWTCKSWAFSAIEYLYEQGIISAMPLSLDRLYDIGSQTAKEFLQVSLEGRVGIPVPTFNSAGEAIVSEVK